MINFDHPQAELPIISQKKKCLKILITVANLAIHIGLDNIIMVQLSPSYIKHMSGV